MKILTFVSSHIPRGNTREQLGVVRENIRRVHAQKTDSTDEVTVVLADDGSGYLSELAQEDIRILSDEEVRQVTETHHLNVDDVVLCGESDRFMKASLMNHYLDRRGDFDVVFVMDDDHELIGTDNLVEVKKSLSKGYNFVVGRICREGGGFFTYYQRYVQGTTYAIRYDLLEQMGFYGEYVKEWGLGDDEDLFWRLYERYRDGVVQPVFNGNIMTRNILTGRWHHCRDQRGGMGEFKKRFREVHGVDPYNGNTSRNYNAWMDYERDKKRFPEFVFAFLDLKMYEEETCRSVRGVGAVACCVVKSILQRGKHRVHRYLSSKTSN